MSKIIGYVILARTGNGFHASSGMRGEQPTLWFGNHLSLFKTRASARQHIKRTKKLMVAGGYDWPWILTAEIHSVEIAE